MRRKQAADEIKSLWKDPIPLVPVLTAVVLVVGFVFTFQPMSDWARDLLSSNVRELGGATKLSAPSGEVSAQSDLKNEDLSRKQQKNGLIEGEQKGPNAPKVPSSTSSRPGNVQKKKAQGKGN